MNKTILIKRSQIKPISSSLHTKSDFQTIIQAIKAKLTEATHNNDISTPTPQTPSQTIIQNFHAPVYGVAANVQGNLQINPHSATTEIDKTPNA